MTGDRHTAREVAQVLVGRPAVVDAGDVTDTDGRSHVELVVDVDHIPPGVCQTLGEWGFAVAPEQTGARLDDERGWHTKIVAFEVDRDA